MGKLQIAADITCNENNEVFTAHRVVDAHMANELEPPDGRAEIGEVPERAVVRELQEKVRTTPQHFSLSERLGCEFPNRHITLQFWLVEGWEGRPWGKEGQPGEWTSPAGLNADDFPPANESAIAKLKRVYAG